MSQQAEKYYKIPEKLSGKEIVDMIINQITRTTLGTDTAMHQLINKFINGNAIDGSYIFENDSSEMGDVSEKLLAVKVTC